MRAFGLFARALIIEALAVGAIVWFAAGGLTTLETASRGKPAATNMVQANSASIDRASFVQSKLERVAKELRGGANQIVEEALASWLGE